ncbi:MAG: DUF6713 family protein [Leadbetterella sp.]
MANDIFFTLGFTFLLMHEMDAIRCKEWRFFPLTFFLEEKMGFIVFMILHIPLFYWFFWGLMSNEHRESFIIGLDYFFIIHLGLHIIYLKHKKNEFKDWISWSLIIGTALFGVLDLMQK